MVAIQIALSAFLHVSNVQVPAPGALSHRAGLNLPVRRNAYRADEGLKIPGDLVAEYTLSVAGSAARARQVPDATGFGSLRGSQTSSFCMPLHTSPDRRSN